MKRLGSLLLALGLLLALAPTAGSQGPGLFVTPDCGTIDSPVTGRTWCFDATAQTLKVYNGSSFVSVTPAIPVSIANGGTGTTLGLRLRPGGRLTLTSAAPVMTADVTAATSVYYALYAHDLIPLYNGTVWTMTTFSELTLALDSNPGHTGYHQSGKLFDLFVVSDGGTIRVGTGPAWTSSTARGTGAGTTQLQRVNGVWTNQQTLTLRWGSASGNTASISANQATYVGSVYATANGQTGMAVHPASASGGNNNFLALWNAYNRVRLKAVCIDSTSTWAYASATARPANNSTSNRISFIDGLGESSLAANYHSTYVPGSSSATGATIGVSLDDATQLGIAGQIINQGASNSTAVGNSLEGYRSDYPQLGLHFYQAMESTTAVSVTFFGAQFSALSLEMEM